MAVLLKPNGTLVVVAPAKGDRFSLTELQAHVGGYIELVPGARMICNEEGKNKNLPINVPATAYANAFERALFTGDFLVGDVLALTECEWAALMRDEED